MTPAFWKKLVSREIYGIMFTKALSSARQRVYIAMLLDLALRLFLNLENLEAIMTIIESILLGILQGVTEFLPVSSSGHLALAQNIFHIETNDSMLFDIMLHLGTLVAVFIVYHRDIWNMIKEAVFMAGDIFRNLYTFILNRIHKTSLKYRKIVHNSYRKFVVLILVSTVPTGIIGVLGKDLISDASQTLLIPGICLLITGVLLLMADLAKEGRKKPKDVTYRSGLLIGAAQGLATLPGLSRSGTTITACIPVSYTHLTLPTT